MKKADNRRQARLRKRRMRTIRRVAICAFILIAAIAILIISMGGNNNAALPEATPEPEAVSVQEEPAAVVVAAPAPIFPAGQENSGLMLGTSALQNSINDEQRALNRPAVQAEGWLPVFKKAATDEKIIAITVDDCSQPANLRKIIDTALSYGQKLTILPIGENIQKAGSALLYAYENGFELENHTYTHNALYSCGADELAWEVWQQNYELSRLLGVTYQCHFLRPKGGDAANDQRIHTYIDQLGYYGVAHWSVSGTQDIQKIKASLAPGNIYLFHTTDKDLERLCEFIPYAVDHGYTLVTLNEMFGYPENETGEFIENAQPVQLREYQTVYVSLSKSNHSYLTKLLQDRLRELGYLKSAGDGIFGDNTKSAVKMFETDAGLTPDGTADKAMLELVFSDSAPHNSTGKTAD